MDGPPRAGSTARVLQAQGLATGRTSAIPRRAGAGDPGRGHPGTPVGAVARGAVSLHSLALAHGVWRRRGLLDLVRPLMHAVSDAHGVSV
jgi:hypothetical protein